MDLQTRQWNDDSCAELAFDVKPSGHFLKPVPPPGSGFQLGQLPFVICPGFFSLLSSNSVANGHPAEPAFGISIPYTIRLRIHKMENVSKPEFFIRSFLSALTSYQRLPQDTSWNSG